MKIEKVTAELLKHVYIRVQDETGQWVTTECASATDAQFDTWAKSRIRIEGEGEWTVEERAEFCDFLFQQGGLHLYIPETEAGEAVKDLIAPQLEAAGGPAGSEGHSA